jgi:transposase-like protein
MNVGYYSARRRKMISDGCPRCLQPKKVTGEKYGIADRKFTLFLCADCHRELKKLTEDRKSSNSEFWNSAKKYLRGQDPYVL